MFRFLQRQLNDNVVQLPVKIFKTYCFETARHFQMTKSHLKNNAQGLRMQLIKALYEKHYRLFPLEVDVADVGHGGATRTRIYVVMAHRLHTKVLADPIELYQKIAEGLKSDMSTRPRDYFVASDCEVQLAASDLAFVRKKTLRQVPRP